MDSRSDASTFCGLALFPGLEVSFSMKFNTACVASSSSLIYYDNNNQASVLKKLVELSTMAGTQAHHNMLLSSTASGVPIVFYGSCLRLNRILGFNTVEHFKMNK